MTLEYYILLISLHAAHYVKKERGTNMIAANVSRNCTNDFYN